MSDLDDDLRSNTDELFGGDYEIIQGQVIPSVSDIPLGKVGRELELAMMFVDIHESTAMIDAFRRQTSAKMYKAFLQGMVRIVNAHEGQVVSFNGDGVLAAFCNGGIGNNAANAALKISWFVEQTLRPMMRRYFDRNYELRDMDFDYGLGIDVGTVLVVRGGIRGEDNSDLVWAGSSVNSSVKIAKLGSYPTNLVITPDVYYRLEDHNRNSWDGSPIWQSYALKDGRQVYGSRWMRRP